MFDWLAGLAQRLHELSLWLQAFIVEVPIYVAAPAMVVIGTLDSSLLSLPEINDYLVVARCVSDPKSVFYFPLFAAAGSVLGCLLLYTIIRRGGQALMRRRFKAESIARVERAYARYGFLALAIPAILPPPMPFKIFVATAGALAVFYGRRVLHFLRVNGLLVLSVATTMLIVGVAVYVLAKRVRAPRQSVLEQVEEGKQREKADEEELKSSTTAQQ